MTANSDRDKDPTVAVELRLDRISRLYNSLDPAPFREKELEAAADAYIVGSAEDAGPRPIRLVVMLPPSELAKQEADHIGPSIRHHFELRRDSENRSLRNMWWRGRVSLVVGLAFLAACLVGRNLLLSMPSTVAHILSEGLLIVGWVAMWGPLDVFLYGWWPIRARWKLLDRLSRIDVELKSQTS
ncbi:MAG: hypothetical protein EPO67_04700 [Reyranella sp.]|nr:MAG: hypothetical protein EPO67_04700 [Reyranella sp.]